MSKCNVCGKETEVFYACSSCGGISFAYCAECLQAGMEPYSALVGMGLLFEEINQEYKESILIPSLKFHGKTIDQFNADVLKEAEAFKLYIKNMEEVVSETI